MAAMEENVVWSQVNVISALLKAQFLVLLASL
jgi:hypothetical protein